MNLYINNLHQSFIEADIHRLFAPYGEIDSVKLIRDKHNNRSRGSAFVIMPVEKQGSEAMINLDGSLLNGKTISVTEVKYDPSFKAF